MSRPILAESERASCDHKRAAKRREIVTLRATGARRASKHEFLECVDCGAVRRRRFVFGRAPARWSRWRLPNPGVCYRCGCSEDRACEEGCAWANEQKTVCTSCVAT